MPFEGLHKGLAGNKITKALAKKEGRSPAQWKPEQD
jgi:hypothetical protein